ncbi:hypothetical protein EBR78_09555 [bacterium]|nr:hypothetical protein [bacterium]
MRQLLILISVLSAVPGIASKHSAETLFKKEEYKKSLSAYLKLAEETPQDLSLLFRTSDLKLLLEGRVAALELLNSILKKYSKLLTHSQKQEIAKKKLEYSQVFISEEAQTHFLQALSKTRLKEWTAAFSPIVQAASVEPGNLLVLNLKADIERELQNYGAAYTTLKEIAHINPRTEHLLERLAEAHIYHKNYSEAVQLLEEEPIASLSSRAKLALAVAHWELGNEDTAKKLIEELTRSKKSEWSQHPVTLWMLYRLESSEANSSQAKTALKNFLKASSDKTKILVESWDPYQMALQVDSLAK